MSSALKIKLKLKMRLLDFYRGCQGNLMCVNNFITDVNTLYSLSISTIATENNSEHTFTDTILGNLNETQKNDLLDILI